MAAIPAWKQALLERKRQQENQEKQKEHEEENRLAKLPPWKRDLLLKKKQTGNQNGSAVINDNMTFGSAPSKKPERPVSAGNLSCEIQTNEDNINLQMNGAPTVTCRDVYNANIANGHTTSWDNTDQTDDSELRYQPGIVSKLRNRFKAEKANEESVQIRRRSVTSDSHDTTSVPPPTTTISSTLPRSSSADHKVIGHSDTSSSKPSRVPSTTSNPPLVKTDIHDNNNIPNGTVSVDSVDGTTNDSNLRISNTETKDIPPVKNKVSSILSVFETDKAKSQPASKRISQDFSTKARSSSVIQDKKESQLKTNDATTVKRVEAKSPTEPARSVLKPSRKTAEKTVKVEETATSDKNLEKIRQAGSSWVFASSTPAPAAQKHVVKHATDHVAEDKPQEEIVTSFDTCDDVPSFSAPPATLPTNGHRELTLTLNIAPDDRAKSRKEASSPTKDAKKKVKPDKKSPTSPEKAKPKADKTPSPEKKKGFFGSLRKDKTKVKVVEVKTKEKENENMNFVVHGVDSPMALKKKSQAPARPVAKPRAPPVPKAEAPRPPKEQEESKPKASVPTSLPATERKTVVLQSNTFHVSPESDVPVTNIDDVILDSSSEPSQPPAKVEDNFDYDFLDDELTITPRPVKFSSVEFAGAGVKLDKSSLSKKSMIRDGDNKKNLKIQFEETSPDTYEYPSEQSLMDSPGQAGQTQSVGDGSGESSTDERDAGERAETPASTTLLSTNPAIGATALGGYRGKFVDEYQLGSKPSQPRDEHVVRPRQNSTSDRESDSGDEVIINPADEDDLFQWSETATADILF